MNSRGEIHPKKVEVERLRTQPSALPLPPKIKWKRKEKILKNDEGK